MCTHARAIVLQNPSLGTLNEYPREMRRFVSIFNWWGIYFLQDTQIARAREGSGLTVIGGVHVESEA